MTNLDSILKSRDITLATNVHLVKAMVFPVVMYGCESWTIKKAEHQRIDAFELWCWRRLLRVPWTARRWNQSIIKEFSPNMHWKEWCWNWGSNTLTTWCEEPTYWKMSWCWEGLKAGGEEVNREWDCWMASLPQRTWIWAGSGRWRRTGNPDQLQSMGSQKVDTTEWLNSWEDSTCPWASKPVHLIYWACALEPMSHSYWVHLLELLKPKQLEPVFHNRRGHINEKPAPATIE